MIIAKTFLFPFRTETEMTGNRVVVRGKCLYVANRIRFLRKKSFVTKKNTYNVKNKYTILITRSYRMQQSYKLNAEKVFVYIRCVFIKASCTSYILHKHVLPVSAALNFSALTVLHICIAKWLLRLIYNM